MRTILTTKSLYTSILYWICQVNLMPNKLHCFNIVNAIMYANVTGCTANTEIFGIIA